MASNKAHNLKFCEYCDLSFSGIVPYNDHLASKRHLKKVEAVTNFPANLARTAEIAMKKTAAPLFQRFLEPALSVLTQDDPFHCKTCDVHCSGSVPYHQHVNSESHKKKLLQSSNNGQSQLEKNAAETLTTSPYFCSVCKLECTGEKPFQQHLDSEKHKKKARNATSSDGSESNGATTAAIDRWRCKECAVECSGEESFKQHIQSEKHRKRVTGPSLSKIETKTVTTSIFSSSRWHCKPCSVQCSGEESFQQHIVSGKHLRKIAFAENVQENIEYFCKVCNVQCSGPVNYAQHCQSDKHSQRQGDQPGTHYRCDLCNVTSTNFQSYLDHRGSANHLKNAEQAKKQNSELPSKPYGTISVRDQQNVAVVKPNFHCQVCNIKFSDEKLYSDHIKSMNHVRNCRIAALSQSNGVVLHENFEIQTSNSEESRSRNSSDEILGSQKITYSVDDILNEVAIVNWDEKFKLM